MKHLPQCSSILPQHGAFCCQTQVGPPPRLIPTDMQLPRAQWREWLCLYPPDEIHFDEVNYGNGNLKALIAPHAPAYTLAHPHYYTASQLVLITSQMCYILAGAALLDDDLPGLPRILYPIFMKRLRDTEIYYSGMQIAFRRKIPNDAQLTAFARMERTRVLRHLLVMQTALSFADDSCVLDSTLVMPVEGEDGACQ